MRIRGRRAVRTPVTSMSERLFLGITHGEHDRDRRRDLDNGVTAVAAPIGRGALSRSFYQVCMLITSKGNHVPTAIKRAYLSESRFSESCLLIGISETKYQSNF